MRGAFLPGNRSVELRDLADPAPGPGQVVIAVRASTICGSDLRAIYREHLGSGAEAYRDVVAGHEPCGEVVEVGPGCRRLRPGDRVIVYHIAGCGLCDDCRRGYDISCESPHRAAYGWQRDGGHADLLLAEERSCVHLPDALDFVDGACVACGFGTAYEALCRIGVSGRDRVLVTGLGPVGMAAGLLARQLGSPLVIGVEGRPERRARALEIGAVDLAVDPAHGLAAVLDHSGGGVHASIDCSGVAAARSLAVEATRRWGRCALVGEGGALELDASHALIHRQLTLYGSWVTSLWRMAELAERLATWGLRPSITVSDRFGLDQAGAAYACADLEATGKVAIVMDR